MKEKKIDHIFYIVIFILLLLVALPMFSFPPHSDHWTLLNFFHRIDDLPKLSWGGQWLHCLNWDPNEQTNFRPLFGIFYYMLYRLFSSNFIFVNIINFLLYFLLYNLITYPQLDNTLNTQIQH